MMTATCLLFPQSCEMMVPSVKQMNQIWVLAITL